VTPGWKYVARSSQNTTVGSILQAAATGPLLSLLLPLLLLLLLLLQGLFTFCWMLAVLANSAAGCMPSGPGAG